VKLTDLTEASVRAFAEPKIFERGEAYFRQKAVYSLAYDAASDRIVSETHGNYGDYDQEIWIQDERIGGECNCQFEGFPCKHLVASLLTFIADKSLYLAQSNLRRKKVDSLRAKIAKLSKEKLVELLIDGASAHVEFKNDLLLKLEPNKPDTLSALKKQIHHIYPPMSPDASMNFDDRDAAKQLRKIFNSVSKTADAELKADVYLCLAERIMEEFDKYGGGDDILEDVAVDAIRAFEEIICNADLPPKRRKELIEQFTQLADYGNSGLDWAIDESMESISENSDE
jgi:hypothetical protein